MGHEHWQSVLAFYHFWSVHPHCDLFIKASGGTQASVWTYVTAASGLFIHIEYAVVFLHMPCPGVCLGLPDIARARAVWSRPLENLISDCLPAVKYWKSFGDLIGFVGFTLPNSICIIIGIKKITPSSVSPPCLCSHLKRFWMKKESNLCRIKHLFPDNQNSNTMFWV